MVFTSTGASVVSLAGYGATRNAIQTRSRRKKVWVLCARARARVRPRTRDEKHTAYSRIA